MKTPEQLAIMIGQLVAEQKSVYQTSEYEAVAKKNKPQIEFLRTCMLYMATKPKEESLKRQLKELEMRLEGINQSFQMRMAGHRGDYSKARKQYDLSMGVGKIKEQIKTLEFILGI